MLNTCTKFQEYQPICSGEEFFSSSEHGSHVKHSQSSKHFGKVSLKNR